MKLTKADHETLSKNILDNFQATYTRESAVYKRALAALLKLSTKDRDALYTLSIASRKIQDRTEKTKTPCQCEHKSHEAACPYEALYEVSTEWGTFNLCAPCFTDGHIDYQPGRRVRILDHENSIRRGALERIASKVWPTAELQEVKS